MITPYSKASMRVWRTTGATFGLLAAVAVFTTDLTAQRRGPAPRAATGATAVETALRLADRLELTQEQRDQLEVIRVELLEQRAAQSTKLMTLTSEIRAGISERTAMRQEFAAMREQGEESRRALRTRYDEIFTGEQKQQLRRLNRTSALRQQGTRSRPGVDRGRGIRGRGPIDGRPGVDRGRGIQGRGPIDRGRDGSRFRGGRRPGGRGR